MRAEALSRAKIAPGLWMCAKCGKPTRDKEVDHTNPVSQGDGWGPYIDRLLYMPIETLLVLCKPCHLETTAERKALRAHTKAI